MAAILGVLFAIGAVIALTHGSAISAWHPKPVGSTLALFAIVLAASFSYIMSWSPYASDYSRYLPEITSRSYIAIYVFVGAAVASFLTEVVGMLVAIIAPGASSSIAALKIAMGGFGVLAVVAVILGATTANVLNLYSNTISAKVLDVRLPRWQLAILGGALGFVVALVRSEEHTSELQSPDHPSFPTRRSSDLRGLQLDCRAQDRDGRLWSPGRGGGDPGRDDRQCSQPLLQHDFGEGPRRSTASLAVGHPWWGPRLRCRPGQIGRAHV